jgi:broad-specificity NMP kinase
MSKPKLVFVIGSQGSGKSTVCKELRETLSNTTLMDLSAVKDKTNVGERQMYRFHSNILTMLDNSKHTTMNWVICRSFMCEKIYCNLGFKEYSFKMYYRFLVEQLEYLAKDFEVFFILLTTNPTALETRLKRSKFEYNPFSIENSMKQQEQYQIELRALAERNNNIRCFEIENDVLDKTVNTIKDLILTDVVGE